MPAPKNPTPKAQPVTQEQRETAIRTGEDPVTGHLMGPVQIRLLRIMAMEPWLSLEEAAKQLSRTPQVTKGIARRLEHMHGIKITFFN